MSRSFLLTLLVSVLLLSVALPLLAQETADIAVGGGLVARLRDRGTFPGVRERAAVVDKSICDIVSTKDTLHPQVSLKQKGSQWTVYAWDVAVLSVYPAEAKANGMTEKQMGAMWAANLKAQLPKATPCSKLPPEMLGYKPAPKASSTTTVTAKPTAAKPPVKTVAVKPVVAVKLATTKPVAKPVAKPVTKVVSPVASHPVSTMTGNESGALLLIVDALRTSREMNDQDWAARKESLAKGLYGDLSYYVTGKGVAPKLPTTTPVKVTATVVKPVAKPLSKPVTTVVKPVVAVKKPATKPVVTVVKPLSKPTTAVKAPDVASMVKVPQKNRIRAKFAAAKGPFDKLQASDPEAAAQVATMLTASRQAFAWGNFDESEKQADAALAALGVTFTGQ